MRASRGLAAGALTATCAVSLAACGGGERQDANEPDKKFRLEVVGASFPTRQSIADQSRLVIRVRNADDKAVPDVAVTIGMTSGNEAGGGDAFANEIQDTSVADRSRPVWIVDRGPVGGDSAYTNTWALGRLKPGATARFVWHLTAVKAGRYTVQYTVSPGLNGKARLAGNRGKGSFKVRISGTPPTARVTGGGKVVNSPG